MVAVVEADALLKVGLKPPVAGVALAVAPDAENNGFVAGVKPEDDVDFAASDAAGLSRVDAKSLAVLLAVSGSFGYEGVSFGLLRFSVAGTRSSVSSSKRRFFEGAVAGTWVIEAEAGAAFGVCANRAGCDGAAFEAVLVDLAGPVVNAPLVGAKEGWTAGVGLSSAPEGAGRPAICAAICNAYL